MKLQLMKTFFLLSAMNTGVFALEQEVSIACEVSDPGQFLPDSFSETLCKKLASDLSMTYVRTEPEASNNQKKKLRLTLQSISEHRAQYSLVVHEAAPSSQSAVEVFGPFIVETMDATLETALPDHLKNDLKRLLRL